MHGVRSWLWSFALACACIPVGCYDTAELGDAPDCTPACSSDEHCHPTLLFCVQCVDDGDCEAAGDGAPFCDGRSFTCEQCRDTSDCGDAGEHCIAGACRDCPSGDPECMFVPHCDRDDPRCIDNRGPGNSGDRPR